MATLRALTTVVRRSNQTLVQDFLGGAALVVMLMVGLHLPAIV